MQQETSSIVGFLNPDLILSQIGLEKGNIVVDFGCGSGYFSLPAAQIVGEGKVYSLDVLPSALESVQSKAKLKGIYNIETKRVNLEAEKGSKLVEQIADWVIVKDMLFQNKNKEQILKEAYRILKSSGKLLIVDWKCQQMSIGPDQELRISQEKIEAIASDVGFKKINDVNAGEFHYGCVLQK